MLLHVSILRSSSGSTFYSLLKLYVKTINTLLSVSVMQQHIVCMCICCIPCREVGRSVYRPPCKGYSTICCCITGIYRVIQEESVRLREMIVCVILSKKVHMNMGPILNGYGVVTA